MKYGLSIGTLGTSPLQCGLFGGHGTPGGFLNSSIIF